MQRNAKIVFFIQFHHLNVLRTLHQWNYFTLRVSGSCFKVVILDKTPDTYENGLTQFSWVILTNLFLTTESGVMISRRRFNRDLSFHATSTHFFKNNLVMSHYMLGMGKPHWDLTLTEYWVEPCVEIKRTKTMQFIILNVMEKRSWNNLKLTLNAKAYSLRNYFF